MSAMSLRLPESLHLAAKELARREGVSVNQLVATALAEKLSALMTVEYLERAKRGTRKKFLAAMSHVPDVDPQAFDALPAGVTSRKPRPTKAKHKARGAKK